MAFECTAYKTQAMKNTFPLLFVFPIFLFFFDAKPPESKGVSGPFLYAMSSSPGPVYKIDLMTCEVCPVFYPAGLNFAISDLLVLPNGNILVVTSSGLNLFDPPNVNAIWSNNEVYGGAILSPGGLIYLCRGTGATAGLYIFDPITLTTTLVGFWPANFFVTEMYYEGGILYGIAREGNNNNDVRLLQINVNNPDQSTVVVNNPVLTLLGGSTSQGYTTAFGNNSSLGQYNLNTNTVTTLCGLPTPINGLSDLPAGVAELPCACTTDAGSINSNNYNICASGSVTVSYNGNAVLDGNDVLRYILFSNLNDPLGSIIVQSTSPTIAFNPATMQAGVTYYLATLAGNNLNGNVNVNDPCADVSNTAQVTWRPNPSVALSVNQSEVCAGQCAVVTALFTGTPPFTLTYSSPAGVQTQTFANANSSFNVCLPGNSPPGNFVVQATALTDAFCACQ